MPSKSKSQARLMAAAAHNPEISKETGIPMSVAKDFNKADAKDGILKKDSKKPDHVHESSMRGLIDIVNDAELSHDIDNANEQTLINTGQKDTEQETELEENKLTEMPQRIEPFSKEESDSFLDSSGKDFDMETAGTEIADHSTYKVYKLKNGNGYMALDSQGKTIGAVGGYTVGKTFNVNATASHSTVRGVVYQMFMDILSTGLRIMSDRRQTDAAIGFWKKLITNHTVYIVGDSKILAKATPEKFHKYWNEDPNSPSSELQLLLVK